MLNSWLKQKIKQWLFSDGAKPDGHSVVISATGIAMGGQKISGLGAPTVQDDALRKGRAEITKDEIAAAAGILLSQLESAVCSETEADGKITTHKGDASAHHAKTVDASELTAGLLALARLPATLTGKDADTVDGAHKTDLESTMDSKNPATTKPSDVLRNSNDTERTTTSESYVKVKEIKLNADVGACRLKFDLKGEPARDGYGRVYKNGVAIGTERESTEDTWGTHSEDFSDWVKDDLIQIYAHGTLGNTAYIRNMRLYYDIEVKTLSMTNQDP